MITDDTILNDGYYRWRRGEYYINCRATGVCTYEGGRIVMNNCSNFIYSRMKWKY